MTKFTQVNGAMKLIAMMKLKIMFMNILNDLNTVVLFSTSPFDITHSSLPKINNSVKISNTKKIIRLNSAFY